MNSKELIDERKRQSIGSSIHQATPDRILYPPMPNSEASERYIKSGFLNTRLFNDNPLAALLRKSNIVSRSRNS